MSDTHATGANPWTCYCDLPLTTVDNVLDRSTQLPGEVAEEPEYGETRENSGEEVYQRHEDCLTVKQNARAGSNNETPVYAIQINSNSMEFILSRNIVWTGSVREWLSCSHFLLTPIESFQFPPIPILTLHSHSHFPIT